NVGGDCRYCTGDSDIQIGFATNATCFANGCDISMRTLRDCTCGSSNTWSRLLIGPHGTPAASIAAIQSPVARDTVMPQIIAISSFLFFTRRGLLAKRSSLPHSGLPSAVQRLVN